MSIVVRSSLVAALAVGAVSFLSTGEAEACGGCFVGPQENTQVTGHRMALSVSRDQTTLWDQISYDGDPSEFAWVLPIRGQVDIGLSSDLLFSTLEATTQVVVQGPAFNCPSQFCDGAENGFGATGSGTSGSGGGVTVIAQEVVGPYETVQLMASDPAELALWLESHGYSLPSDVAPLVTTYVNEGFGFLALRLVPGQGIDAMRPVRVTSPGASPQLPLRMVAAGTGAKTPIALWVLGEGRYEPANFPVSIIEEDQLFWDYDTNSSTYAATRQALFESDNGSRWVLEAGEPMGDWVFADMLWQAEYDPEGSGYADETGENAIENAQADIDTLLAGINSQNLWISRMSAELSRQSLGYDLRLQASADQTPVSRFLNVTNTIGSAPTCPPPPDCGGSDDGGFTTGGFDSPGGLGASSCGVSTTSRPISDWTMASLLGAALWLARGRRKQNRSI